MTLPSDYAARKAFPLLTVLAAYFPDAIEALVDLCIKGNAQHDVDTEAANPFKLPGDLVTWDRSKSTDQMNTLMRHAWDHERARRGVGNMRDADGVLHILKVFWRAGAEAQLTLESLKKAQDLVGELTVADRRAGLQEDHTLPESYGGTD